MKNFEHITQNYESWACENCKHWELLPDNNVFFAECVALHSPGSQISLGVTEEENVRYKGVQLITPAEHYCSEFELRD